MGDPNKWEFIKNQCKYSKALECTHPEWAGKRCLDCRTLREDITHREFAKHLGYTAIVRHPCEAAAFAKGNKRIWFSVYNGPHWQCAEIIKGKYCNHRSYVVLREALEKEA